MKPTPPELGHHGKLPSNKIEVSKKTTSFFYSKPIPFIVNFGYFVVLTASHDAHEGTLSLWTPSDFII